MPEDNNISNNSNQGVAWYVKPTLDTIDFLKGIPVNVLADPDNVKVFDNYVKIKSGGLNMVIPIVDAAAGKKEWDEAIARGAGDVVQDLAVSALASSAYVAFFGSNPVGWGAVGVGAVVLGVTWITSANDMSFGAFLEQELINIKNDNKFDGIVLDNKVTKPREFSIKDYITSEEFSFDKSAHTATINTINELDKAEKRLLYFLGLTEG